MGTNCCGARSSNAGRCPRLTLSSSRRRLPTCFALSGGAEKATPEAARLIWTLPAQINLPEIEESYHRAAKELVNGATRTLTLVSPYLEPKSREKAQRSPATEETEPF